MRRLHLAFYKSVSYRIMSIISVLTISVLITGDWIIASSIALIDQLFKTVFYFFHERLWEKYYRRQKHL